MKFSIYFFRSNLHIAQDEIPGLLAKFYWTKFGDLFEICQKQMSLCRIL